MASNANYFKIGIFVIIAIVLIIVGVIFWGAGQLLEEPIYLETYIDESVQGLSEGSQVYHRGVAIGNVHQIEFVAGDYGVVPDSNNYDKYSRYVRVVIAAQQSRVKGNGEEDVRPMLKRMVDNGLRLRLITQPLTGVAYLEADYLEPQRYTKLEIDWQPKYLYIPSAPSVLSTLLDSAEQAFREFTAVDIEKLADLTENMLASIPAAINDANVGAVSRDFRDLMSSFNDTNARLQAMIGPSEKWQQAGSLADSLERVNGIIDRMDRLLRSHTGDLDIIVSNLREVSTNLKQLSRDLRRYPSQLIFSRPPDETEVIK